MTQQIVPAGEEAFEWVNGDGSSPIILVCEHASNFVPSSLTGLGLEAEDLSRHIAYDIGAAGVARTLARMLNAPLILQRYSRLIYDCNRSPEQPSAMPEVSEVYAIAGNKNLSPAQRQLRIDEFYRPFHHALEKKLDHRAAEQKLSALVSIHSFSRTYHGQRRDVDLGLLFDRDERMAKAFGKGPPDFVTLPNAPYGPADGVMHLMNLHAAPRGLQHLMIEICNDLIETEIKQEQWAAHLAERLGVTARALGENK